MESEISAVILLAITLPVTAAATATEPEPATLMLMARISASRSSGVFVRTLFTSLFTLAGRGTTDGADSIALMVALPPEVTIDPPVISAVIVFPT